MGSGVAPPLVWVRQYPPVPPDANDLSRAGFPLAVWLLDKNNLHSENVWKWRRFAAVHFEKPWCGKMHGESSGFNMVQSFGFAAFVPCAENTFLVDVQFAGSWGYGWRVNFDEQGNVQSQKELWIS